MSGGTGECKSTTSKTEGNAKFTSENLERLCHTDTINFLSLSRSPKFPSALSRGFSCKKGKLTHEIFPRNESGEENYHIPFYWLSYNLITQQLTEGGKLKTNFVSAYRWVPNPIFRGGRNASFVRRRPLSDHVVRCGVLIKWILYIPRVLLDKQASDWISPDGI